MRILLATAVAIVRVVAVVVHGREVVGQAESPGTTGLAATDPLTTRRTRVAVVTGVVGAPAAVRMETRV